MSESAKEASERSTVYYHAHRTQIREKMNKKWAADPQMRAAARSYQLKRKFGIDAAEYDQLLAQQGHACAICRSKTPGNGRVKFFAVDHDHQNNTVRGLLCVQCNTALGNLRDQPDLCEKAAAYLRSGGVR